MSPFQYRSGQLFAEDVPLSELAARFGTPCFVYSRSAIEARWRAFENSFGGRPHLTCYAVKANGNLTLLSMLARLGSGFDIVSGGELQRVLKAGGDPGRVVFSGVGKRADEIEMALQAGILCFNVESVAELHRLDRVAMKVGKPAHIALRVNTDVKTGTHPYVATALQESKFGIAVGEALDIYREAASLGNLRVRGIACHIGSQITALEPFLDSLDRLLALADRLAGYGITIRHIDVGGGLGIRYHDEAPPQPGEWVEALCRRLGRRELTLMIEPGRSLVGDSGLLLTRVEYLKHGRVRNFAVVDAAMNDLLRPALYQAWQEILPVRESAAGDSKVYDVVGPVCESADFLGLARALAIAEGDLLAVLCCGAYASCMSSNYNARPRAPEIIVEGKTVEEARRRETIADMIALETSGPIRP